jgi:hypothetical protein
MGRSMEPDRKCDALWRERLSSFELGSAGHRPTKPRLRRRGQRQRRAGVPLSHGRYQRLDAEQRRRLAANFYLLISTAPDDAYMAIANMLPLGETEKPARTKRHPTVRLTR